MCGITGFWSGGGLHGDWRDRITRMSAAIRRRGPDGDGQWADTQAGVVLAHRRLAIVDLTEAGRQPMLSHDGRYAVTFNGEIYNFRLLRGELERQGVAFRTESDTEVLLSAVAHWGVREALKRFIGMFAFALFDRAERRLWLARDRLGKKPLYIRLAAQTLVFGSDLRAVECFEDSASRLDMDAARLYLARGYVPAPLTILQGVQKLSAGELVSLDEKALRAGTLARERYWVPAAANGHAQPSLNYSEEEALEHLQTLLKDAVDLRMIADVPLGAFLSGGIDSSLVVAVMQSIARRPVRTFSIGFREDRFDESKHARNVAAALGTDHCELFVDARQALDLIPKLPDVYDEPYADPSAIPTVLLCALTRNSVTVALSGDGGDESFCGYNRYVWMRHLNSLRAVLGKHGRRLAANALRHFASSGRVRLDSAGSMRVAAMRERAARIAAIMDAPSLPSAYHSLTSFNVNVDAIALGSAHEVSVSDVMPGLYRPEADTMVVAQLEDLAGYLPDGIMVKVDRASMAYALEARAPLMDHRVVEFALSLPRSLKVRQGRQKWLLRRALDRYLPDSTIVDRPKQGFGIPLDSWLMGPLRDWAEELLSPRQLDSAGLLNGPAVTSLWRDYLSGRRRAAYEIWSILMFQAWHCSYLRGSAAAQV